MRGVNTYAGATASISAHINSHSHISAHLHQLPTGRYARNKAYIGLEPPTLLEVLENTELLYDFISHRRESVGASTCARDAVRNP
jgi:hypothetical protein